MREYVAAGSYDRVLIGYTKAISVLGSATNGILKELMLEVEAQVGVCMYVCMCVYMN